MLDLEFVLDQIDVLQSKLEWAQLDICENIKTLQSSLTNYNSIKKEIDDFSNINRARLS